MCVDGFVYTCVCVCVCVCAKIKHENYMNIYMIMTDSSQMIKLQIKYDAFNRMDRQQLNDAISEKER